MENVKWKMANGGEGWGDSAMPPYFPWILGEVARLGDHDDAGPFHILVLRPMIDDPAVFEDFRLMRASCFIDVTITRTGDDDIIGRNIARRERLALALFED